jgi:glucose/mannose-6-phosphate isomerase
MLDSAERTRELDTRGMLRMITDMPDHLRVGYDAGRSSGVEGEDFREVVVCGLGGSAIGGDMAAAWLYESCPIPVSVIRSYSLPAHVGPDSLVIAMSYSGNTEETLSMVQDAQKRRVKVVAVSSGGRLREAAEEGSMPHCEVPSGLVPRATVGYLFGAMSGILDVAGIAEVEGHVVESQEVLRLIASHCGPEAQTQDNPAKKLAHQLHGTVPVSIGYGLSRPVAKRWANQFNENAKMIAFSEELPEMDHNSIVGWVGDPRSQGYSVVFLDHDSCDAPMARRVAATKEMLSERLRVFSSEAVGSSGMARMFSLVMMGDYTSVYSALLRGEDPSTTAPIETLKRILSERSE